MWLWHLRHVSPLLRGSLALEDMHTNTEHPTTAAAAAADRSLNRVRVRGTATDPATAVPPLNRVRAQNTVTGPAAAARASGSSRARAYRLARTGAFPGAFPASPGCPGRRLPAHAAPLLHLLETGQSTPEDPSIHADDRPKAPEEHDPVSDRAPTRSGDRWPATEPRLDPAPEASAHDSHRLHPSTGPARREGRAKSRTGREPRR